MQGDDIVNDFTIERLNHFAYRCRDAEETRRFYEDILGLPLAHVIQKDYVPSTGECCPYTHIFFKMGDGSFVAFFDLGDDVAPAPSPNTPSWVNHLALQVPTEEQLIAAKARLEKAGVPALGITDHEIIHSIYFFDPNGLRVELTTWAVDQLHMDGEARLARKRLDAWTEMKRSRTQTAERGAN
jgi:catechol 2,3-dioxygenase-like lactoylglutathione lyase family enzyme